MRRLILIVLLLSLLGGLLVAAQRLQWIGAPTAVTDAPGPTIQTRSTGRAPEGFALKMSPRLSQRPGNATPAAETQAPAQNIWSTFDLRWFALILGASLLGMAFMRAWREPNTVDATATEATPRNEPVFDRDTAVDTVNAEAMRKLRDRLFAVEDDLHTSQTARGELAQQIKDIESQLGEAQDQAVALQATLTERDHDIAEVNAALTASKQELEQRDRQMSDLQQALVAADEESSAARAQIASLDQDGVDQRVITVEFEKALLSADDRHASAAAELQALQQENVDLDAQLRTAAERLQSLSEQTEAREAEFNAQLHAADQRLQALNDDTEAHVATLMRNAEREHEDLQSESRATIEALTHERDALASSLAEAQAALKERDTTLEDLRRDLQLHVDQVEALGDVRDRLSAWQPTVDTLRSDLRAKDDAVQALREELDQTTGQLIAARTLADEVTPLKDKLAEQSALARVLKDAADSMRLYKNASDTRAFQMGKLQDQLNVQSEQLQQSQEANDTAREDIAALRRDLSERDQSLQAAQLETEQGNERIAQLQTELARESEALQSMRDELSLRQQQVDELSAAGEERTQQVAQLETTLAEQTAALTTLREQMAQQQDQRAALEDEVGQLEALTLDIGTVLESPVDALPAEPSVDTRQLHRDARLSVQRVRERLEIVQDLERALELDLEDSNACLRMTESESIRVNDALNALMPQLKDATSERDQAHARVQTLEDQVARFEQALEERTQLEQRCAELQSQLDEWQSREHNVVERIDLLAHDRSTLADKLAATRSAHDEAAARAQRETVQRISLHHRIEGQRAHIEQLETQLSEKAQTDSELTATRAQLETARTQLATTRNELTEQTSAWQDTQAQLESRLSEADAALSESRAQYVARAAEIDALIRQSHEEREQLTRQLESAQREERDRGARDDELATANLALRDALKTVRAQTDEQIQRLRSDLEQAEQSTRNLNLKLETSTRMQSTYANAVAKLKADLAKSQALVQHLARAAKATPAPTPKVADKPVRVPVLSQPVSAPPVLRSPVRNQTEDGDD